MKLYEMTLKEVSEKIKNKEITSLELTESILNRIKEVEPKVDSFISLTEEYAINKAKEIDEKIAKGENLSPLAGVPMAVKDNICTDGIKTTCASKMLENFVPPYDATAIKRLNKAGAVMVGKTNMDEFAMGSSTENSAFKKTKNPWDLTRVPGGSSGGSASAVAAGQAFYSLGSDTGGSVKQPASLTGLVGLRPTYGRISRYGLIAFGSSLDQIGIFAKDVTDCALVLREMAGKDNMDGTSANVEVPDYTKYLDNNIKGLKIGVPKEYFGQGVDEDVKNAVLKGIELLKEMGAQVKEISLPHTDYAVATYYVLAPSEASSNLARFDGIRYGYRANEYNSLEDLYIKSRSEGFGDEVKRRIMIGTYALSAGYYDAYYKKALKVRTLIKDDFVKAFEDVDVIITPTAPNVAFKIGEKTSDPMTMYMEDICTIPSCLAGVPGMSIPCGFKNGLPIGMQIIGNHFDEATMLKVAYAFECATDFKNKRVSL
ncbi:aspartyl/glutamyl-tRNA(Asn/Gln) amidotransferase subunit A [Tepidibacter formicigenes DSM 15518]|uniref:Glutamyl-tRNA(Gln) amidotransferase subunit A n=1 Tax=Tepidibacter formicigenes DSM 15518 TaxID=1123349 RepID=A0A1M6JK53_9FIRM|nr:Asp-tRNA(Asn)/Glu-tRNA(Gln) amidotransferase subunit GatA [Tepidibacter formicigenes]SHJ47034.1 aspartyl/glutamyl-tRNA(Asn/Gln) amidotransferase subunit A [Tepidibacter formicigenes DSM 15518]